MLNNGNYRTALAQVLETNHLDPSIVQPLMDKSLPLPPLVTSEATIT